MIEFMLGMCAGMVLGVLAMSFGILRDKGKFIKVLQSMPEPSWKWRNNNG